MVGEVGVRFPPTHCLQFLDGFRLVGLMAGDNVA